MIDAKDIQQLAAVKMAIPAEAAAERGNERAAPTTPAPGGNKAKAPRKRSSPRRNPNCSIPSSGRTPNRVFPPTFFKRESRENGKLFFGAGDAGPTGAIRIFEVASGKQIQEFLPGKDAWFNAAAFVPGGKYLAAGYNQDKDLYLWEIATGKVVRKFVGHTVRTTGSASRQTANGCCPGVTARTEPCGFGTWKRARS